LWLAAGLAAVVVVFVLVGRDGGQPPSAPAGAFVGGDLHSLVVDPSKPERLFAGGHHAVSVSSDGGRSWQRVPSLDDADAMGWAFTGDAIWVSGHPGLSRSTDGGRSFARANRGLPDTDVHAFGAGPGVLYGSSPSAGVFASTDGGRSWEVRSNQAGHGFFGRMVVDQADADHVVAADAQAGVVESTDGGRTWRRLPGSPAALWLSSAGPGTGALVASGSGGAARSDDGGRTWRRLEIPDGAVLVEAGPAPGLLYAAAHRGDSAVLWVSRDGGTTWARP
jgi:photosystem II stability/assembly factor-like uncharacterized protein